MTDTLLQEAWENATEKFQLGSIETSTSLCIIALLNLMDVNGGNMWKIIGIVIVGFLYYYNYSGPKVDCPSDNQCSTQIESFFKSLPPEQANSIEMAANMVMQCKILHSEPFRKLDEATAMANVFDGATKVKFATKATLISTFGSIGCWVVGV